MTSPREVQKSGIYDITDRQQLIEYMYRTGEDMEGFWRANAGGLTEDNIALLVTRGLERVTSQLTGSLRLDDDRRETVVPLFITADRPPSC